MAKGGGFGGLILILARLALGGVLFYAGFTKIGDAHAFAEDISHYKLLPGVVERALAVTLPWVEVLAGAMLVFAIWTRAAALIAGMMFAVFAVAVGSALARGINITCGCFGKASAGPIGMKTLLINAGGLLLALVVYYLSATSKKGR